MGYSSVSYEVWLPCFMGPHPVRGWESNNYGRIHGEKTFHDRDGDRVIDHACLNRTRLSSGAH
jgi:hypothetical protein